ncbi:MAG: hypothetical protein AAF998_29440, partial [Bacteroidota bacterium]
MKNQFHYIILFFLLAGPLGLSAQVVNSLANAANTRTEYRFLNAGSTAEGLRIYIGPGNAEGNAAFLRLSENRPLQLFTNDLERLRIAAGGNVG